ncbi:MAG: zinc-binding protein [Chloroflexota bacterium]
MFTRPHKPAARGLTVCARCERDKPRCAICQTPMPSPRVELNICAACLREGLRCRACGARIRGKFLMLNGNDGPYCEKCHRDHALCDLCGAPASARAVLYADGRVVCQRCAQTAITDPRQAEMLFDRVVDLVGATLGLRLNVHPRLMLVDHARLGELARHAVAENGHDSAKTLGLFARMGRKRVVYVQEFLPRILLIQVAAHEFAHAWQGENAPLLRDPVWREGFAEWVAYHALTRLDAPKKAAQMIQRRDVYGEGLRRVLEAEKQKGIDGVLQECRNAR